MSSAHIDPEGPFVVVRPSEPLSPDVVERLLDEVASLPEMEPGMPRIWDLSGVDLTRLETRLVKVLVERLRHRGSASPGTRVAIVAPSDLTYGLSRMFEMLREGSSLDYRVFRELPGAKAWAAGGE